MDYVIWLYGFLLHSNKWRSIEEDKVVLWFTAGDPLSLYLFIMVRYGIFFRKWLSKLKVKNTSKGFKSRGEARRFPTCFFADDSLLFFKANLRYILCGSEGNNPKIQQIKYRGEVIYLQNPLLCLSPKPQVNFKDIWGAF